MAMSYATTSHIRSTGAVSVPTPINTNTNMDNGSMSPPTATPPPEGPKTKRKGTRSVSTLTPAQLARKRANDREAQRAIRARTKEHIERLEREISQYKKMCDVDYVQQLQRRNKDLEDELMRLRKICGDRHFSMAPDSAMPSRSSSYAPGHRTPDGYGFSHIPTPDPSAEPWHGIVVTSSMTVPMSATASSPAVSAPVDEFPSYIATTGYNSPAVSGPVLDPTSMAPTSNPFNHHNDMEYETAGIDSDHGLYRSTPHSTHHNSPIPQQSYQMPHHQASWGAMNGYASDERRNWLNYPPTPSM